MAKAGGKRSSQRDGRRGELRHLHAKRNRAGANRVARQIGNHGKQVVSTGCKRVGVGQLIYSATRQRAGADGNNTIGGAANKKLDRGDGGATRQDLSLNGQGCSNAENHGLRNSGVTGSRGGGLGRDDAAGRRDAHDLNDRDRHRIRDQ